MRLVEESYLLDSYGRCLICEWQWDGVNYTKWHHLIEDHDIPLHNVREPIDAPFIWEIHQRIMQ